MPIASILAANLTGYVSREYLENIDTLSGTTPYFTFGSAFFAVGFLYYRSVLGRREYEKRLEREIEENGLEIRKLQKRTVKPRRNRR